MNAMQRSMPDIDLQKLQQLDPAAWSALLQRHTGVTQLRVSAIETEAAGAQQTRYNITLDGYADAITLLGKRSDLQEARFYHYLATDVALAPRCLYSTIGSSDGWVILADAPHDRLPETWLHGDVEEIVRDLADLHAAFWGQKDRLLRQRWLPFLLGGTRQARRESTSQQIETLAEAGSVSLHALRAVEGLAPRWVEASNGLRTLLDLDGWQGVIEEKHLRALGDLLDDPLPLLHPLRELPLTLVHGYPGIYNWRVSLFESRQLVAWQTAAIGPGICDLATFLETFDLLQTDDQQWTLRSTPPISEETMIDCYILRLSAELGSAVDTYAVRRALPAARCLHVLLHWLPRFHKWFAQLPSDIETRRAMWQALNTTSDEDLAQSLYRPIAGLRPYLSETFQRFLRYYYQIQ